MTFETYLVWYEGRRLPGCLSGGIMGDILDDFLRSRKERAPSPEIDWQAKKDKWVQSVENLYQFIPGDAQRRHRLQGCGRREVRCGRHGGLHWRLQGSGTR